MILPLPKTVVLLFKSQIASNVEGEEVVPVGDVEDLILFAEFGDSVCEFLDVVGDDGFLFVKRFLGE